MKNIKENWVIVLIIFILLVQDVYLVYKLTNDTEFTSGDIVSIIGLTIAIFSLFINTFLDINKIEKNSKIEVEKMEQELKIAQSEKSSTVLTKYRMDWLGQMKVRTSEFEENLLRLLLLTNKSYEDNKDLVQATFDSLTNYISFLKSEMNLTKKIDYEIINNYEMMNVYLSFINELKVRNENSYLEKCIKANSLQLISDGDISTVKSYSSELKKYEITQRDLEYMNPEDVAEREYLYGQTIQDYMQDLPSVYDVENKLLIYFSSKIKDVFDEYSLKLRLYFKTEWERIKHEINSLSNQDQKFDFDTTYSELLVQSQKVLADVNGL